MCMIPLSLGIYIETGLLQGDTDVRRLGYKSAAILIGCVLIACGVDFFLVPFHILDGGLTGFALIINYTLGFPVGITYLVSSIPVFMLAWTYKRDSFYASIHGMWISCLLIDVIFPLQFLFLYYIELSPLVSALVGGVLIGSGLGIILRVGASTGGIDMVAQLLAKRLHINVGFLIASIDILVITLGGSLLHADTFLLSALTVISGGIATGLITMKMKLMNE
jgi:uncharacterized membrane-anchored protein YitT (DUF2179 family)